MNDLECTHNSNSKDLSQKPASGIQNILVFQQNGSGIKKIEGLELYGNNHFSIEVVSIDADLPTVIDDTKEYIPRNIEADLVLDYLKHPDLSYDLAMVCRDNNIPVVASGKKFRVKGVFTPPT
jgi:thymidylate synthase